MAGMDFSQRPPAKFEYISLCDCGVIPPAVDLPKELKRESGCKGFSAPLMPEIINVIFERNCLSLIA